MTPESALKNKIMIECGQRNWICLHLNVGKVKLPNGYFFNTGVPVGFPDLTIITDLGVVIFIETKIKPRKPTPEQLKWIENLKKRGFIADVVYTLDSFKMLLKSHGF